MLLVAGWQLPADASSGSPAPVGESITSVAVSPSIVPFGQPVKVVVTWCVPNGSHPGDAFALTVPAELTPLTTGFALRDSAGALVATAAVVDSTIRLTVTSYVVDHAAVCGNVQFFAAVTNAGTVNRPNRVRFTSGRASFWATFTAQGNPGALPTWAIMYGAWIHPADQGRTQPRDAMTWYYEAPLAPPATGQSGVVFSGVAGGGQEFDCARVSVELGTLDTARHFVYSGPYAGTMTTQCGTRAFNVAIGTVAGGTVARLVVPTTLVTQARSYRPGAGAIGIDGEPAIRVTGKKIVRYAQATGIASGTYVQTIHSRTTPTAHVDSGSAFWPMLLTGTGACVLGLIGFAWALRRRARPAV